jgi:RNA-binding protein YhbY
VKSPWATPKAGSVPSIEEAELELLRGALDRVSPSLRVGHKSRAAIHVVGKLNAHLASDGLVAVEFVGLQRKEVEVLCAELAVATRSLRLDLRGEVAWFFRPIPQRSVAQVIARL